MGVTGSVVIVARLLEASLDQVNILLRLGGVYCRLPDTVQNGPRPAGLKTATAKRRVTMGSRPGQRVTNS